MGLRFRKSITLCKGVRLNIGKTGVSLSAGVPGFRKTIHSSGRVTTSVGIPGTGIYYVDTKNPKKDNTPAKPKRQNQTPAYTWQPKAVAPSMPEHQPNTPVYPYTVPSSTPAPVPQEKPVQMTPVTNGNDVVKAPTITAPMSQVQPSPAVKPITPAPEPQPAPIPDVDVPSVLVIELFEHCDYPVKWIDVLTCKEPPEDGYNLETWEYLRSKAIAVFEGNVDAMLDIVEHINPYDDLLDYLTEFKFEADDAECLEITCSMLRGSLGKEKEDAAASLIIRLARDTFALLPVASIRIHVNNAPPSIISDVYFERDLFAATIFESKDPSKLLDSLSSK